VVINRYSHCLTAPGDHRLFETYSNNFLMKGFYALMLTAFLFAFAVPA
jgi:hypothetical protein